MQASYPLLPVCPLQQIVGQSLHERYGAFAAREWDSPLHTAPFPEHTNTVGTVIPPVLNWKSRCCVDPWKGIAPVQVPESGERLVTSVVNQRHTVLFSPPQWKFSTSSDSV
ncbi:unnamed protein product [Hydatigera taeniaeformis]|uniref:Uncharacterized protein n=1 Tax=Hydatigena taeniaeformis TaxID=6205 RepID=A0A0R3WSA2_HYDTA|nr:unnamed protein product [Hydatigera taeniaeformis]